MPLKSFDDVNSWEVFEERLETVRRQTDDMRRRVVGIIEKARKTLAPGLKHDVPACVVLYRGQSNAAWALRTTLERQTRRSVNPLAEHLETILKLKPEIEKLALPGFGWVSVGA